MGETTETTEVKGQDGVPAQPATEQPPVTPAATPGSERAKPVDWEAKYKSLQGQYNPAIERLKVLEKKDNDYTVLHSRLEGMATMVEQVGQSVQLLTEIVSSGAEVNDEIKQKMAAVQTQREEQKKVVQAAQKTYDRIKKAVDTAGIPLDDPTMKGANEAFRKGEFENALDLTIIAIGNKSKASPANPPAPPAGDTEKAKGKATFKQITSTPSPRDMTGLSSSEKIKAGLAAT